jgi:hypothetical protein
MYTLMNINRFKITWINNLNEHEMLWAASVFTGNPSNKTFAHKAEDHTITDYNLKEIFG